jgi:hypothetical protein
VALGSRLVFGSAVSYAVYLLYSGQLVSGVFIVSKHGSK